MAAGATCARKIPVIIIDSGVFMLAMYSMVSPIITAMHPGFTMHFFRLSFISGISVVIPSIHKTTLNTPTKAVA